ncbi:DUF4184 family protein [Curtobacterium caseinilyticum]|uniref:DUF4184 family protein n=1 Tax=Curtobacterium caseinilyticum TaxID=3055137 RepID=A0ABT7TRV2_9MICO|nr:DUF4184 family protein [Curtobacterium caseinilyticum]MDM7892323.1 DUF4184 family protein [Curtobacterium caseinilyticum]
MPFTVSHAVVALGARRLPVPVAAVAVGSMAPDAVLFAPFLPPYEAAHSWWGVLTIDLAVSLVVLAVWWTLVRPAWTPVVPGLRRRLPEHWAHRPRLAPRDVLPVVLGCVLGSVTHVLWDGFTHESGFVVRAWPALRDTSVGGEPLPFLLQDASSVLGLLALLAAAAVWWRRARVRSAPPLRTVEVTVPVVALAAVVLAALAVAARALLTGGGLGVVVTALAFRVPALVAVAMVVGAVALLTLRRTTTRRTR